MIWNIVNTSYSLSHFSLKGFFNGNGVEYDIGYAFNAIGYASRGAKNYGCLISRVLLSKVTVW